MWGGLLLSLINISLIGIGFSSWLIGGDNDNNHTNFDVSVGKLESTDYYDSVYYVLDSEHCFSYYNIDNEYEFTDSTISFDIKINFNLIETYNFNDVSIDFSLEYSLRSLYNFDIFKENNGIIESPNNMKIYIVDNESAFYYGNNLVYEKSEINGTSNYKLSSKEYLNSEINKSIYNSFKYYKNINNILTLKCEYNFTILNKVLFLEHFKDLSFVIKTSLRGK